MIQENIKNTRERSTALISEISESNTKNSEVDELCRHFLTEYNPILTAKEVGEILRVQECTVRKWTMTNKIPHQKRNGITRYLLRDVISWLVTQN